MSSRRGNRGAHNRMIGNSRRTDPGLRPSPHLRRLALEPLESRRVLAAGPLHVDAASGAPEPDGLGWDTAYSALRDALDPHAMESHGPEAAPAVLALQEAS